MHGVVNISIHVPGSMEIGFLEVLWPVVTSRKLLILFVQGLINI